MLRRAFAMVTVTESRREAQGIRFGITDRSVEVGRAFLYVMHNDLHSAPFGLLEDVFVDEAHRGLGFGTMLVERVIVTAKAYGCYKLLATSRTSRPRVHEMYERLGFTKHGLEFRMDFPST
jgi:GNAT superfamily N-acetyltransferase